MLIDLIVSGLPAKQIIVGGDFHNAAGSLWITDHSRAWLRGNFNRRG